MMSSVSTRKPEIGFVVPSLPRHHFLHFDVQGFHPEVMGADVSQIVARLDPWPACFLHTRRVGALQRQAVIEEFTKDRVLTPFKAMAGFHFVLSINLWFSQTGLLLSRLSFAPCLLTPFFSLKLTLTQQTRGTPTFYCRKESKCLELR